MALDGGQIGTSDPIVIVNPCINRASPPQRPAKRRHGVGGQGVVHWTRVPRSGSARRLGSRVVHHRFGPLL